MYKMSKKRSYFKLVPYNSLEEYGDRMIQVEYAYDGVNGQAVYLCEIEYEQDDNE